MKKTTKIFALLLVLVLSIGCLCACKVAGNSYEFKEVVIVKDGKETTDKDTYTNTIEAAFAGRVYVFGKDGNCVLKNANGDTIESRPYCEEDKTIYLGTSDVSEAKLATTGVYTVYTRDGNKIYLEKTQGETTYRFVYEKI